MRDGSEHRERFEQTGFRQVADCDRLETDVFGEFAYGLDGVVIIAADEHHRLRGVRAIFAKPVELKHFYEVGSSRERRDLFSARSVETAGERETLSVIVSGFVASTMILLDIAAIPKRGFDRAKRHRKIMASES
ncbi:MAG: hypothetical protein IPK58_18520 [Acidobacteria bacterium]|nr:hypothetical protein [Acidobacteriota bacterium]